MPFVSAQNLVLPHFSFFLCLHVFQMNDMAEKLAPEVYDINNLKSVHAQVEALLKNSGNHTSQCSSLVTNYSMSYHHTSRAKPLLINKRISNMHDHQMVDSSDGARDLPLSANDCSLQHGIENDAKPPKIASVIVIR